MGVHGPRAQLRGIVTEAGTNLGVPLQGCVRSLSRLVVLAPAVHGLVPVGRHFGAPPRQDTVEDLLHHVGTGHDIGLGTTGGEPGADGEDTWRVLRAVQLSQQKELGQLSAGPGISIPMRLL
ncbi:hypothetical protein GCM10022206_48200 [Streptomyces chiangmaiensis]